MPTRPRVGLVALATLWLSIRGTSASAPRSLTLDERVAAQRAIEEVYWRHRIWPKDNPTSKPSFDAVMPERMIRGKVEDTLAKSSALESLWHRPITGDQLQAELDRMARGSRDSRMLQELFDALGDDSFVIAETLARQSLAERLVRNWYATDDRFRSGSSARPFDAWWKDQRAALPTSVPPTAVAFKLPPLSPTGCANDTWSATFSEVPDARIGHTAVWTGTEMIVWGGETDAYDPMNTGGRYNPATDMWTPTSTGADVPFPRSYHTAVWTGTEMIVWGGRYYDRPTGNYQYRNTGGRYDPASDTWTATSMGTNLPQSRCFHTAVWSGSEMIVWGGGPSSNALNTGGRYNPSSNSWAPTSTGANVPSPRKGHVGFWTGTEMLVWGGYSNTGGRYNPTSDSWTPTSTGANLPSSDSGPAVWTGTEMIVWSGGNAGGSRYDVASDAWQSIAPGGNGAPSPRSEHSLVWTGSRMIVWGGVELQTVHPLASGAAFDPSTNVWTPIASMSHSTNSGESTIWTGTEMIVWGGYVNVDHLVNSGLRYNPASDSWVTMSLGASVPSARVAHSALWTGAEMIVWGGDTGWSHSAAPYQDFDTGGRYDPATDSWTPTSLIGAPSPRDSHSAVWTGREMIVWGGGYAPDRSGAGSQLFNTGARYDPVTDHWTPTSTAGSVPSARAVHAAVWTGREMLIGGGCCSVTDNGRYDPVTDSWHAMASGTGVPAATGIFEAFWTGTEMLTWNGSAGARYAASADSWTALPSAAGSPPPSSGSSAVWTGTEMIVWGGFANTGSRFNPLTNSWTPTSTGLGVPGTRSRQSAVWTGRELIIWGGTTGQTTYSVANNGARYDPTSDAWTPASALTQLPQPSRERSAVWTGTEMILWGGLPLTATGDRYCACPSGRLIYRDADGDGYGDATISSPSCDGSAPAGYAIDHTDCNDTSPIVHPGAAEMCNGLDDDCDGLVDEGVSGEDTDTDAVHDLCDNCPFVSNPAQSDFDHDSQGDACDLDDGLIYEWRDDKTSVSWQAEAGPTSWNIYVGDLDVLKATGVYTQLPGSNPLADRHCGEIATVVSESGVPPAGKTSYSLITGVADGVESSLGSATSGPRPNTNPCP